MAPRNQTITGRAVPPSTSDETSTMTPQDELAEAQLEIQQLKAQLLAREQLEPRNQDQDT